MKFVMLSVLVACFTCSLHAQVYTGDSTEIQSILKHIDAFSQAYMNGDYDAIANAYTRDGKIMPAGTKIIEGRTAIRERWVLPEGVTVPYHKIRPEEITILGDTAYDIGYYEGRTRRANGEESSWQGKYVIIWKKVEGDWKIYVDIWNRVTEPEK
jgi:ketosteroid isomerase-like protein